jgi:diaminopropionate ammonia-lyase
MTAAEMLSCGEASAPAMKVLRRHGARVVTVSEDALVETPHLLRQHGGPATTPSGAAGLAGLVKILSDGSAASFGLTAGSRVLILVTETDLSGQAGQS